jgi:hypothetical protein
MVLAVAFAGVVASSLTISAAAAGAVPSVAVPVMGAVTNATGGGSFTGTLTVTRFVTRNGQIFALGNVSGLLTTANGVTSVITAVAAPVDTAQATATCSILNLVLGPLHLNVLGLVVDLNQVVLNVTAESGAGNLLGNLLCGIAGLLDNPAGLTRLLNDLLAIL